MSIFQKIFGPPPPAPAGEKPVGFRDSLRALRHLLPFFRLIWRTHRGLTFANVLLRLFRAGTPLAQLWAGRYIVDEVVAQAALEPGTRDLSTLWFWLGAELAFTVLSDLLSRGITLTDALLGDLFSNQSSLELMEHAARLDLQQFENAAFYDKLERARRQTTGRVTLMSLLLTQVQDLVTLLFLAAGLAIFNPWLILLVALAVIPAFLAESWFNQQSYSLTRSWTPERRELDYLRYIGASDETAKEAQTFGLGTFLRDRFAAVAGRYYEANRRLATRRAIWGSLFNAIGTLGYYGAYVFILLSAVAGALSLGALTFLSGSFLKMHALLQGILSRFSSIAQQALYLQDFFDFLAMQPGITAPARPRPIPQPIQQGFVFEDVGFCYPGSDIWALRHVNFTLHAGEKLALVGENGAGKTTLVKLLARLYDTTEGRILLDGHDLREYDPHALRQAIGVIFQDFIRFAFSAGENIAIGQIGERENQALIQQSAHQSLADAVVERLPRGYDTLLGKRFSGGVELSGGEWQKVALARAYMREAQLMILDEPTAALDARAEYEVFQRFAELTRGRTSVLISHRFSTVRMADRILVLRRGGMEEIGTHEELMARGGLYAELFRLQAMGYQ